MTALREREIERQKQSNSNAAQQHAAFTGRRRRLTELLMARREGATGGERPRLCVLGAGNCGDLDLERLASRYRSIHLADIDPDALERWKNFHVTPDELLDHPARTSASIAKCG